MKYLFYQDKCLPGIATIARRYIMVALVLAFLISALTMVFGKRPTSILAYFFVFERIGVSTLMLLVLLIVAFLVYYPVPLHRNVIVYSIGYAVYFLTKAAGLFVRFTDPRWSRPASTVLLAVSTTCLLFWLSALTKSGEKKTIVIGHQWDRKDEERLLLQLKEINASLMRAARK